MSIIKPEGEPEHIGGHYEACTRAFGALALAHGAVSAELEKALAPLGLSINEFDILVGLDNRPQRTSPLCLLAGTVRLSQPAMSRLTDRLEKRGLICKSSSAEDRRSMTIQLTDAGSALLQRAVPLHESCIREKLLACLTEEERGILRRALLKIAAANGEPASG